MGLNRFFAAMMVCFFSTTSFAQESSTLILSKNDLRSTILEMIKRNIVVQNIQVLKKSGYSDADVEEIVLSPSFQNFLKNVVHAPAIAKVVDQKVETLLTPGYLEGKIRQRLDEADTQKREDLLLVLQELGQYRNRPSRNLNEEKDTFFTKLWKQVKKDLFG